MGQSLSKVYLHTIFHIKAQGISILPETREALYAYIGGITRTMESACIMAGGTTNHVHLLCTLPRTISIAKLVEEIKRASSKWLKTQDCHYAKFEWQAGYGAFSVSQSQVEKVKTYINNQMEHHAHKSAADEYMDLLAAYETEYDPRYFLRD